MATRCVRPLRRAKSPAPLAPLSPFAPFVSLAALAARVAIALAVSLGTSAVAFAQTIPPGAAPAGGSAATPAAAVVDAPRVAFERGMQALQGGRYADAVQAFEQSYAGRAVPVVLYNLGLAYRGLGRVVAAVDAFDRYLASAGASASDADTVRTEAARLRATFATLRVDVDPADATIRLDGRTLEPGARDTTVDPGAHVVDVTREGRRPEHRDVSLAPGAHQSLRVVLASSERRARLSIVPSVLDAAVFVDTVLQGSGDTVAHVPAGEHNVEVRARGYRPFQYSFRSDGVQPQRVVASLVALPRPGAPAWVTPTVVAGVLTVAAAVAIPALVSWSTRPTAAPYAGSWGVRSEP